MKTFKTKAAISILLCTTILIQFCIPAFAIDVTRDIKAKVCAENVTEPDSPLPRSSGEYNTESKGLNTDAKPGVFERTYKLNDRSSDPLAELKIVNDERLAKTSGIELSFEGIPENSIVTKAILRLVHCNL